MNPPPTGVPNQNNPNNLVLNGVREEPVDQMTGQQFIEKPSTLDTELPSKPLFPTIMNPQSMPVSMNPANPTYSGR